jgi:hypothetical protein
MTPKLFSTIYQAKETELKGSSQAGRNTRAKSPSQEGGSFSSKLSAAMYKPAAPSPVSPAAPKEQPNYTSIGHLEDWKKAEALKDNTLNTSQLNPYDQLQAERHRWAVIAQKVEKGNYTPEQKTKIAENGYKRMILPYYERMKQPALSHELWMQHAYGDYNKNFNIHDAYDGTLSNGMHSGVAVLMQDTIEAAKTGLNILGALVSPPKPITDESWQETLKNAHNHPEGGGYWDGVVKAADRSPLKTTALRGKLTMASGKLEMYQALNPNRNLGSKLVTGAVDTVPFVAAAMATEGTSLLPEAGEALRVLTEGSRIGKLAAGALETGRDGAVYGFFTKKDEDKAHALREGIDWAVGSVLIHVGGEAFVKTAKSFVSMSDAAGKAAAEKWAAKGQRSAAGRTQLDERDMEHFSEAGVSEIVATHGPLAPEAVNNAAAEHILKMENSGLSPREIHAREKGMLDSDKTGTVGPMLDSVIRIRSALQDQKLSTATKEEKAGILSRLLALQGSATGRMTKNSAVLQESLRRRFTSMKPETLDKNVMKYLLTQVAPTLPSNVTEEQLVKATQEHWADLVVKAGIDSEEAMTRDPLSLAKKAELVKRDAVVEHLNSAAMTLKSRTKSWSKGGQSGVSFSLSPEWNVYAKNALKKSGKTWTAAELKSWINDLGDDEFAADIHAYFIPRFMKDHQIHFESGHVQGGNDHTNLYAFAWNYKNQMPREYAERLEEEYLNSPKMKGFLEQHTKGATPAQRKNADQILMRRISLAMWNHTDNFLGSGRFPKELNIFRSTQSDLMNPTEWQADLFKERHDAEVAIVKKMYDPKKDEGRASLDALQILFSERVKAFKSGEQGKLRSLSENIADRIIEKSKKTKQPYVDWGLR